MAHEDTTHCCDCNLIEDNGGLLADMAMALSQYDVKLTTETLTEALRKIQVRKSAS